MSTHEDRAKTIFLRALEITDETQRQAFLEQQCAADKPLRGEVEELLRHEQQMGSFLQSPALEPAATEPIAASSTPHAPRNAAVEPTEVADAVADELSLDFLSPSENPEHLGRLGAYEITEVIGSGGMGVALRGHDLKLGRVVVVKVLAPQWAANPTARKRFLREGRAAAAVNHPHVVGIYAVDESQQTPYLVLEYVDGMSLQQKLDRDGELELKEILRIGMQVASGLAAAHAQGLIHRDVKPSNILLENGVERAKLTDFGLARAVDDVAITRTGEVTGTPQYMSPEQAQGRPVDQRTDLFSLGTVLYAMCTGRSPFRAETTMASLRRVCDETPRPIREINAEIPEWLGAIIEKLLAKDPDERFQTAAEVAELLGGYLAHLQDPLSTPPPASPSSTPATFSSRGAFPARKRLRGLFRRRWLFATCVLLVLFGGLSLTEATGLTSVARFVGTVLKIRTPNGTLVLDIDDPGVRVAVEGHGEELTISGAGIEKLELRPGRYRVRTTKEGRPIREELVTISRGGREVVRVTLERAASKERPTGTAASEGDLLKLIDPEKHALQGKWRFEQETLVSPGTGRWDRVKIPYEPPEEYDLEVTAERKTGSDMLAVVLVSGSRQFFVGLDMFGGRILGLGLIDGKDAFTNETKREQSIFKDGLPHKVLCRVRRDGVQVTLDGNPLIDWRGDLDRLSVPEAGRTGRLGLATTHSTYHIYDLVLRPVGEQGASNVPSATVGRVPMSEVARYPTTHSEPVFSIAVSPDGRAIATGASDDTIHLFDRNAGTTLHVLEGHFALGLRFASDGRQLLSAGDDGTVRLWNVETGEEIRRFEGHAGWVLSVDLSPDGRTVLSGGEDGTIRVWDFESKKQIDKMSVDGAVEANVVFWVEYSEDGGRFVTGHQDGRVIVWNGSTRKAITTIAAHTGKAYIARFSPDGRILATTSNDDTARLWDIETGRRLQTLPHGDNVTFAEFIADGRFLLTGSGDKTIRVWHVETGQEIARGTASTNCTPKVALLPDGHLVSAGGLLSARTEEGTPVFEGDDDYDLHVWRLPESVWPHAQSNQMTELRRFVGHTGPVNRVAFSPDGTLALSGSGYGGDLTARLWDVATGREIRLLNADGRQILAVCFSPDGRRAAGGGFGGVVCIWDATTGGQNTSFPTKSFPTKTEVVANVAFSPDGRHLLCVAHKRKPERGIPDLGTAQLWDTEAGEMVWQEDSEGWLTTGEFLSDERIVIAGWGTGAAVHVLDRKTGKELQRWQTESGEPYRVEELDVSHDGRFVATSSELGYVCLWDVESGGRLIELKRSTGYLKSVAFSPDGRRLLIGGQEGRIQLLDVPTLRSIASVKHPSERVWNVAFSPNGRVALSAGGLAGEQLSAYALRLWRLPESVWPKAKRNEIAEVRRFEGHTRPVTQVAISPDGTLALSGSGMQGQRWGLWQGDRSVRLWEVATGKQIRSFDTSGTQILTVCFSHDGRRAAAGGYGGVVYVWDVSTGRQITSLQTDTEVVEELVFSRDGRHLLCVTRSRKLVPRERGVSDQGTAQLWDMEAEEMVWETGNESWLVTGAFLPDLERVAVAGWYTGAAIHFLDRKTGEELQRLNNVGDEGEAIEELAVSYDGQLIATASEHGYVGLWNLKTAGRPIKHRSNMGNLTSVKFSPDGRRLLCAGGKNMAGRIQLLDVPSLKTIVSVENLFGKISHVAYSPDGRYALISGGWGRDQLSDYALRLWRLPESVWPKQSAASAEPGAFVVLGQKGFQRKFDTLAEAVAASNPGDTIEIRGDGPFVTDPIEIGHPLAIRAGEGFRPVVKNAPWIEGDERHLLSTDSPVVLEGLEVINTRDEPGFENWGASLHCTGPSAQLANCRFVKLWTGPIEANANSSVMLRTSSAVLRNCDFSQRRGYCLAWWFEPRAKLTLDNCVFPRVIGLLPASRVGGAQIRITRSTFSDRNNIGVHATDAASRQSFDAPSLLEFDVTETIFDQWNAMMVVVGLDSAEAETTVSNCIAWSDTRNIFSAANSMLICGPPWNPPANNFLKYDKALTAWKRYWNEPDAQVLSGRIRFTVADLMSKRSDAPQSITPEDFRLRPDSAGYRAGPGGRDLGADIDLVGPGAAYERWKKTPEYQGWLEETRRLMAESQTAEVHHRNSHEPSRVGPAVAPRPSTDH